MAQYNNPGIVTSGLIFSYDMNNRAKSWFGVPTTNLNSGASISTYLNTPSDVTSSLTTTGELYKGQPVYKQVLTPITATGVSYLTNAGNPGIGVVTGGGGGLANRYTGHSIFFKPALGRNGLNASTPIYTHYSNISGWQTTGNYDDMGDGWYRAHVIYYNSGGGSDGKYWAINPAGAVLNVPITIYWAAPFKEDRNDSTFVSAYTYSSRSNTQAILDLTRNSTCTINSLTYNSDGTFNFTGSSSNNATVSVSNSSTNAISKSWEAWVIPSTSQSTAGIFGHVVSGGCTYYCNGGVCIASSNYQFNWYDNSNYQFLDSGIAATANIPVHVVGTYDASDTKCRIYINGVLRNTSGATNMSYGGAANSIQIGYLSASGNYYTGKINVIRHYYNKALSATEVQQNFSALRGRFGV